MALLSVPQALDRLLAAATKIEAVERLDLYDAHGRVLAEDVVSKMTQPPFDASAMDGYALRGADVVNPCQELTIIGQSAAGQGFDGRVEKGQTVRIFTGAPMPQGADTVLLQEDAERLNATTIRNLFSPAPSRHVRPRGQDFTEGEIVLSKGNLLDAGRLTLAASANHPALCVFRKPRIALIATGNELVAPGTIPAKSQIIASNSFGVAALAVEAGAQIIDLGIVGDDRAEIMRAIDTARAASVDIIVTLGGASVGDHDLVQSALVACGMKLDFWKVAMRPGKPLMVGDLGGIKVLGLPGNPVSGLVCALLFLQPLVAHMGRKTLADRRATATLSSPLPANDHRQDYIRAALKRGSGGEWIASHFGKQDSSQMKIFANADCLIIRPPQADALVAGSRCEILVLRLI